MLGRPEDVEEDAIGSAQSAFLLGSTGRANARVSIDAKIRMRSIERSENVLRREERGLPRPVGPGDAGTKCVDVERRGHGQDSPGQRREPVLAASR